MPLRRLAVLIVASVASAAPAAAQELDPYRGVRYVQAIDLAVERAYAMAVDEAPGAAYTAALHRLQRESAHLQLRDASAPAMRRFGTEYRRARRALMAGGAMPSEALLDAWDDVAAAWQGLRRRVPLGSAATYWRFEGELGAVPVSFTGSTLAALHADCLALTERLDVRTPRRITIRGEPISPRGGPLGGRLRSPAQLCAIVALNARPIGVTPRPLLIGAVEGVPFALYAPTEEALDALHRYLFAAIEPMRRIDDVRVGDRRYHPLESWTPDEVVGLLERALLAPAPGPMTSRAPGRAHGETVRR